jgi:hypothetical protein
MANLDSLFRLAHLFLEPDHEENAHANNEKDGEQAQKPDVTLEQQIQHYVHGRLPL